MLETGDNISIKLKDGKIPTTSYVPNERPYMVSFDINVKPLVAFPGQPKKTTRKYVIIHSDSFKKARDDVRAMYHNLTLSKGGIGNLKVTELTPEQYQEYLDALETLKPKEDAVIETKVLENID